MGRQLRSAVGISWSPARRAGSVRDWRGTTSNTGHRKARRQVATLGGGERRTRAVLSEPPTNATVPPHGRRTLLESASATVAISRGCFNLSQGVVPPG